MTLEDWNINFIRVLFVEINVLIESEYIILKILQTKNKASVSTRINSFNDTETHNMITQIAI